MTRTNRIYFMDNLRAFVILLVVVIHGLITYTPYAPSWWYVIEAETSVFFTVPVLLIDVPVMFVLFFISGYFAFPSLRKRSPSSFLKNKFIRVGLPWIFGVLFLAPPVTYLIYLSRGIPVSYLEFWSRDFWQPLVYQQSVYWYLGILFLMFTIMSVIYSLSSRFRALEQGISNPTWKLFVSFAAVMTVGFFTMNLFFPLDAWIHVYIFAVQPERAPLYVGYFILGIYAYKRGWFTAEGYKPGLTYWAPLSALSGAAYLGSRYILISAQTMIYLMVGVAALFNVFCFSSIMAGLAFFQRYVNGRSPFWRSQAANSYGIYYVHPLFLYPLSFVFIPVTLSLCLKAPIVIITAILMSWGSSVLASKTLSFLNRAF